MSLFGSRLSVSGLPRRLVTGRDNNDSALLALRILRRFQCCTSSSVIALRSPASKLRDSEEIFKN